LGGVTALPTEEYVRAEFARGDVFFVQVGSNDGLRYDPIYELAVNNINWSGLLIEPVRSSFEELRKNYGDQKRFIFENLAVGETEGRSKFYCVSKDAERCLEDLPNWYDQLGSFDRNHIVKHLEGRLEPFIEEIEVACMPLGIILERHKIEHIDLVHIDAEGADLAILLQLDLAQYRPRMIIFESWHMSRRDLAVAECRLSEAGYRLTESDLDTIATRC
jgi:FkbM family methyltransferase